MSDKIRERVWDIELALEEIKKRPHTYNTLLEDEQDNKTHHTILRRKLNRECRIGKVFKTSIPGTRFGKAIFYVEPKDYYILVESKRTGSAVFYFFEFEKLSNFYIEVKKCWELKKGFWVPKGEKSFFEGNVLMFI